MCTESKHLPVDLCKYLHVLNYILAATCKSFLLTIIPPTGVADTPFKFVLLSNHCLKQTFSEKDKKKILLNTQMMV